MPALPEPNKFGLNFHHLGLAVKEPQAARAFLSALGYEIGPVVFDPLQKVNLAMCGHASMPSVEIVWPADESSPVDRFVARCKEGLVYHVCYTTDDFDRSLAAMKTDDAARLLCVSPPKPAIVFGGKNVSFYLVEGIGLIEIIDNRADG